MDSKKIEYFKNKLINEKAKIYNLLELMKRNETIDSKTEISTELSFYDNHPSDIATELYDIEKGYALKNNELNIMSKIDSALESIDKGIYGKCKGCGIEIPESRLEFIPYAEYCTKCQDEHNKIGPKEKNDRPVEEKVLGKPFGYGYNDNKDDIQFDAEDSYQSVEKFNRLENIEEYYYDDQEYVEAVERISNQQYIDQLPD